MKQTKSHFSTWNVLPPNFQLEYFYLLSDVSWSTSSEYDPIIFSAWNKWRKLNEQHQNGNTCSKYWVVKWEEEVEKKQRRTADDFKQTENVHERPFKVMKKNARVTVIYCFDNYVIMDLAEKI